MDINAAIQVVKEACNCYVNDLTNNIIYGLHWGAHDLSCPVYRLSRDPVDAQNDDDYRQWHAAAIFSRERKYRYLLRRRLKNESSQTICTFIMLNPSTADERKNDPSVIRCMGFAEAWGYGWLEVCNLFAFRSTESKRLKIGEVDHAYIVGVDNDHHIAGSVTRADLVVVAWGAHGKLIDRGHDVLAKLNAARIVPWHFNLTHGGEPVHPLYLPKNAGIRPLVF